VSFFDSLASTPLGRALITFIVAMVPVAELRAAIPVGVSLGLPHIASAAVAIVGNMVPVPFIILFARRVIVWMKSRSPRLKRLAERLEKRASDKGEALYKGVVIGLMVFVAIPLPGTGAWTGALIAAVLDLRLKYAVPAIALGVVIAGILVTGITFGFTSLF
jgi:uncharacterized membrane protein